MFFWYTFQDGYRICVAKLDKVELMHEVRKHGQVTKKERA